jgi:ADP-L-glycero-D-manno-heptose 6-epimerase
MRDPTQTQSTSPEMLSEAVDGFLVITGAAGFIGSRLVRKLYEKHNCRKLLLVDEMEFFSTRLCCEAFRNYKGLKFLSPADFQNQFEKAQLEVAAVFHIGACSRTDEMRVNYLRENNTRYSQRIWEACSSQKIPLYYASSAATYGAGELGYVDDPSLIPQLKPLNPYGQSKQDFDVWVLEQIKNGSQPPHWAGFKFFNVYGPGEEHKGSQATVMFHAYTQFKKKGVMTLFRSHKEGVKDGEQKRDFVFVDDVCNVIWSFYVNRHTSGIYNVGTGRARTFLALTEATAAAMGIPCKVDWIDTPAQLRAHYQYFTEADLQRLRKAGYHEEFIDIEEGARRTIEEWSSSLEGNHS